MFQITDTIFSKPIHSRVHDVLETEQCWDQTGFKPRLEVDRALAVFNTIMGKAVKWNVEVWCASLDLRTAFDRMEFKPLFDAPRCQGIPGSYTHLLDTLYRLQSVSVEGGHVLRYSARGQGR